MPTRKPTPSGTVRTAAPADPKPNTPDTSIGIARAMMEHIGPCSGFDQCRHILILLKAAIEDVVCPAGKAPDWQAVMLATDEAVRCPAWQDAEAVLRGRMPSSGDFAFTARLLIKTVSDGLYDCQHDRFARPSEKQLIAWRADLENRIRALSAGGTAASPPSTSREGPTAGLRALLKREAWRLNALPPGVDVDTLRALDVDGLIEVRPWYMVNHAKRPGIRDVRPEAMGGWFSPAKEPEQAGRWDAIARDAATCEPEIAPEVRLTERGRVEASKPAGGPSGDTPPPPGASAEARAYDALRRNPDLARQPARVWAEAIGCSVSRVRNLKAWKTGRSRLPSARRAGSVDSLEHTPTEHEEQGPHSNQLSRLTAEQTADDKGEAEQRPYRQRV
ncbi:MAG: hypothetical protein ACKVS8_10705 [Phycisphaerales bacterium]